MTNEKRYRVALERIANNEAFHCPGCIDYFDIAAVEGVKRQVYARLVLDGMTPEDAEQEVERRGWHYLDVLTKAVACEENRYGNPLRIRAMEQLAKALWEPADADYRPEWAVR